MPNVYISLGVHGFFRDAPTTLISLTGSAIFRLDYLCMQSEGHDVTLYGHSSGRIHARKMI